MTKTAWRYEIKYGPEGEANYAWVYDADGEMVCTAKTHHAEAIVTRMNATPSLQGEDAVERVALPPIPDDDADFTPDLARKIIAKYQALLATGLVPDEAAIRVDEREKCAKIAESDALHDQWPLHGSEMQAPSRRMQIAIAAAIRSGDNP